MERRRSGRGGAGALLAGVPIGAHFPVAGAVLLAVTLGAVTAFLPGRDAGQGEATFALPPRALLALGAIAFCGFLAEGTVNDWSAVHLAEVTGASAAVTSLGHFAFSLTMIAVRLCADRGVAALGAVRVMRWSALTGVAGFGLVVTATTPLPALLGYAVVGLGMAAVVPMAWSAAAALARSLRVPGRMSA